MPGRTSRQRSLLPSYKNADHTWRITHGASAVSAFFIASHIPRSHADHAQVTAKSKNVMFQGVSRKADVGSIPIARSITPFSRVPGTPLSVYSSQDSQAPIKDTQRRIEVGTRKNPAG